MKHFIAYLCICLAGIMLAYNSNVFEVESANAVSLDKPVVLPKISQNDFKLNFDLNTGKSVVESNVPVSTDITVNHPTKIVEKVVEKPIEKEVIVYKTLVMFPLKASKIEPFKVDSVKPLCLR